MRLPYVFGFILINIFITISIDMQPFILHAENLSDSEYILGPEDVIDIKVWDNDDLNLQVEISQQGSFTFPLIGKVKAKGLSVFALEKLISEKLADGYIKSAQVTVNVRSYKTQKVFVLGQVKKPGVFNMKGNINILELISMAGGFGSEAERTVTIVRPRTLQSTGGGTASDPGKGGRKKMFTR
ncbi:MAG: polysaccharide export protein [Candidatus Scalindua sp.]|nr:polysaccharide export protein [Candidatus Scalindua sp.]